MGRKNKNARRAFDTKMSFKELCSRVGISPKQRIIIRRYLLEKYQFKGGENYGRKN